MAWRIGVDIGGTFTDVALVDEASGRDRRRQGADHAAQTSPRACSPRCDMAMQRYGDRAADVGLLSHATTVVTNAILEEKGARAALVTTRGFRDVLELRRSARADLYDLFQDAPATLIPRRRRFEITERIGADGSIVTPLAEDEIDGLIAALKAAARRGDRRLAAVQLPQPRARAAARRAPARGAAGRARLPVLARCCRRSRSSSAPARPRCAPTSGRSSPPIWSGWRSATRSQGLPPLYVMGSNGGILEAGRGRRHAGDGGGVGPGGRRGGGRAGGAADRPPQPALLRHGRHHRQGQPDPRRPVRDHAGIRGRRRRQRQPLDARHRPSDPRAGDRSGRGVGRRRLDRLGRPRRRAARRPEERRRRARARCATAAAAPSRPSPTAICCSAISTRARCSPATCRSITRRPKPPSRKRLAEPLGVDVRTAAAAVIDVVNHAMAEALKIVSVQRGHDPREFVLAAFGGAGPLHAAALAERARHRRGASARRSPARSRRSAWSAPTSSATTCAPSTPRPRPPIPRRWRPPSPRWRREGAAMLDRAGVAPERRRFERSVDARYERQSYELSDAGSARARSMPRRSPQIAEAFHDRHRATYGHDNRGEPVQLVSVRLAAIGAIPPLLIRDSDGAGRDRRGQVQTPACGSAQPARSTPPSTIARRMPAGLRGAGPAVIESLEVHHSRAAGLAGDDERGRLRAADAPASRSGRRAANARTRSADSQPIPPPSRSSRTASTRSPRRCASSSPRPPTRRS